jgi:hypothetical protein
MLLGKTTTSCSWQYVYVLQYTVFLANMFYLSQYVVSTYCVNTNKNDSSGDKQ